MDVDKFNSGIRVMLANIVANSGGSLSEIDLDGYATSITDFAISCAPERQIEVTR